MVILAFLGLFLVVGIYLFITNLLFELICCIDDTLGQIFLCAWICATIGALIYWSGLC
jgi:hypothetical protein